MSDEGFLARWSRRKQAARHGEKAPPQSSPAPQAAHPPANEPPELPPLESLTAQSDFTVFMQPGVPESLRKAALSKLWRSDPVFANLDGLVEYGEDYAAIVASDEAIRTVYRVLGGMPDGGESSGSPEPPVPSAEPPAGKPDTLIEAAEGEGSEGRRIGAAGPPPGSSSLSD
jgi:Protein of unknown function (DUF3306)